MAKNNSSFRFFNTVLILSFLFFTFNSIAQWKIETSGGSSGYRNAVKYNATGDIYVLLQDASNGYKATVQKKNGSTWQLVGNAGFSTYQVYEPSIAINQSNGDLFVTYIESISGIYKLSCNKWNGSSWVDVGTPEFVVTGANGKPGITVDNNGNPLIVTPFYNGFYVYQFDGSNWNNLTANPPGATPATTPLDILYQQGDNGGANLTNYLPVVNSSGEIFVAVSSPYIGNDGIIVMKYASGSWTKVGSNLPGGTTAMNQRMSIAPDGTLYVSYSQTSNSSSICKIFVYKWNGSSWVDLASSGTQIFNSTYSNFNSFSFDIAFDSSSTPYVIYQNTGNDWRAICKKYNSGASNWTLVRDGGLHFGLNVDAGIRLFLDNSNQPFYTGTNSSEPRLYVPENAPLFYPNSNFSPSSGTIGANVYINFGDNFTGATDVKFNGVSASFTVNSDNSITAVVPANATTGTIAITNAVGTTTSSATFTVTTPPTITSFTPSNGTIGSIITITGTDFTGATAVSFNGTAATSFTVNSATQITATVPSGATTGTIAITTSGGTATSSSILTLVQPLAISSISPSGAEVGDIVSISGTGFNATPANNIVYFGGVQAKVSSASATSLSVVVPNGSSRHFVTVTTNGSTVLSSKKFNIINNNISSITTSPLSFAASVTVTNIAAGGESAGNTNDVIVGVADFDNDGWPDVFKGGVNAININRNLLKGTNTTFAASNFSSPINYAVSGTVRTVAVADIDSDGKLDIVTGSTTGLSILRNTSTTGVISFAAAVNVSTSTTSIRIADFNFDGKLDVAAVAGANLNIFTNNSTAGSIAFNTPNAIVLSGTGFYGLDLGDLNNDGKIDIVVSKSGTTDVIVNNSSTGSLSLTNSFSIAIGHVYVIVDDLDKDGKNDIYLYNKYLKNSYASGGLLSTNFTTYTNTLVDEGSSGSSSLDLNGDAYPEIYLGAWWSHLWMYINNATGTPTSIFSNRQTFVRGNAAAADLNGDQKVDMITSNVTDLNIGLTRNTISPASGIYATCSLTAFTQCSASPSTTQTISISGTNLTSDIVIAAAPNFEYSLDNTTFSSTLTLAHVSGTVAATNVYVRYNRADLGSENVNITISSSIAAGARKLILSAFGSRSLAAITGNTSVAIGQTTTLTGSASPSTTTPWASSNTGIASVNSSGVVSGVSGGTVTITYTNSFGCQATQSISVLPPPTITSFTPTSCPVGTTVTITGTNFTGATAVKFNGTTATYTVVSATSITATVPVGATSGTISVTNSVGTATSAGSLTVTIAPPVITSLTPNTAAPGDTVIIVGTGFDATASNNVVLLDGMRCSITAASSTSLSVIIPKGATYNNFQVVNVTNKLSTISKSKFIIKSATLGAQVVSNSFYLNTPASLSSVVVTSEKNYSTADIDADGKLDILAMNNGYSLKIAATSSTPSSLNYTVSTITNSVLPVANAVRYAQLRDYNNDGLLDLMTTEPGTSSTGGWVNINNSTIGSPSFNTRYTLTPSLSYNFLATDVITSDFNNDGRIDILGAYRTDSYFTFCKNTSTNGTFSEASTRGQGASATNLVTAAIEGEFTGDAKVDFFVLHGSVGDFVTNNTAYDASSLSIAVSPSINLSASILRTGDLDNDGDLDIIATNTTSTITILTNNGTGTFTTSSLTVPSGTIRGIQLGDLDGDGDVDIIYATSTGFYYLPNSTITSNSIVFNINSNILLSNSVTSYGFKLVDLNEDNKFDILYSTGTALNILINKIGQIPTITLSNSNLSSFTECIGTTSVSQNFILSATNLTANVSIAALAGFEFSLDDTTYSSTLTIPFGTGTLTNLPVYVRLTSSATGTPSGSITLSSTNATNQTVSVSGSVTSIALPTVSSPTVQSFTTLGASTWTAPVGVTSIEYLVVGGAGGGATGYDNAGGGGGGAGMALSGRFSVTPGTTYPIYIGDGGLGGANARANNWGVNGENSSFATITALGGNKGKGCRSVDIAGVAQSTNCSSAIGGGGSGGGFGGKGGGGAVGNGSNNASATGGAGGTGLSSSITGSAITYGIGGAGGNNGTVTTGTNGAANTGNGGKGGSALSSSSAAGGKGGSGIVIIKYATQATTINYCQNETAIPLQATALSGNILQWYTVASGGSASSIAPTPSTSSTGTTTYYVSQKDTVSGCESARLAITVTINAIPTAPTTANSSIDYCQGTTANALSATSSSVNLLQWNLTATYLSSCTPIPNTTVAGVYVYNATQMSNVGCVSPQTSVTISVFANPTAPSAVNDTLCINTVANPLTASVDTANTLQWYTVPTGGTASTSAIIPNTSVSGTINYYVSQKTDSSGCESPRTTISINVPNAPYPYDRVVNFTNGGHLTKAASASINLNDWTVEAWIYPTAFNTLGGIVSKRDFQFATNANGALSVMIERNWSWELATTANNVITLNNWQHVAASYNASTKVIKIYVNGVLVHTFTRSQTFAPDFNTYDFKIGYNNGQGNGSPSRTFAGNIDEVKVWNTVRTDGEVSSNYSTELIGNENGLIAYYKFDQGIGGGNNTAITSLTDLTANANHLTPLSSSPVYTMNGATNNILQIGPAILSTPSICLNTTSILTHTNSGGSWSSSDTTIISVNSSTGVATALGVGTATITYTFTSNGCTFTSTKLFTVLDVPTITAHPATTVQNVCINTAATALSITATGAGLTYQWYKNTTSNASGGVLLTGATAASYTPVSTTAGTLYYYCIVNGTCSPADTSSISGAITVSPVSVAGTVSGTSAICSGTTSTLTLSGNVGSTIQWQRYENPIWTDLTGETATTFTTPALTATTTYRASVTSGACAAAYTAGKVITVNPLPVISGLTTVGAGNQITLTATTTAASSNAWFSTNTSNLTVTNVGVVTGISPGNAAVVYSNNNGCKDTLDITVTTGTTLTPILTSPATNTTGATTLTINYTLPEAPLAGSVTLTFTPVGGGTPIVWNMNNLTNPTFNYVVGSIPTTISNITSGSALGFTTYDLTLAYSDSYNNPSASVTNTNIQTLAPPAISFSNATYNQVVNVPISIQTNNTGGALATFTISPILPSGLVINPTTGLISGTTSNSLNLTSYTVTATNAAGTDTEPFNLFIDLDTDGDGVGNTTDPDIDGDGISNGSDVDPDGDGVNNNGTDTDGDGINDSNDADIDGDGILNTPDSDVNGDGIIDNGTDADGDGINDANDPDIDGDGIPNGSDADANGDGVPDTGVTDTDGDGIVDSADSDVNGDGVIDNGTDTDTDGVNDANDPDIDGDGIPNIMDADSNGDGVIDNGTDTDGDGINDANDPDIDGDGILNGADVDVNGDGVIDNGTDTDNDGVNDSNDTDIDGDGIPNVVDADPDGDGTINNGPDTDGDGINDVADADVNGDGVIDNGVDTDNDGINDGNDPDIDGDGIPNGSDADVNGDGVVDNGVDTDGDGVNDANDTDIDGDGLANSVDNCPNVVNPSITTHPSTQLVNVCPTFTPPTLSVTAIGQDLTYQWYVNTTNTNVGGTLINGATNSTYVPSNALVGPRYYYVVVNGLCGMSKSNISGVITIQDIINPTVVTQPVTIALNAQGTITLLASQVDNGSSDNCGVGTLAVNPSQFNCNNIGANTVTLTVTDDNGNSSSATAIVTVIDTIKPIVNTQNISVYLNAAGQASITAAEVNNVSTDNCGIASMTLDQTNFTCSNTGVNTVTLTVTDVNGNVKTNTAIVTVLDTILPTVITQNAILYLNASGQASITAAQINNGSFDNCGVASVVLNQTAFTCTNVGSNTVTLTVTDTKGNVATGNAIVTIVDNTPPTIVVQNINAYLNTGGAVTITPSQVGGGSSDNCSIATMTLNNTTFNCSNLGANSVILTVVDPSNNVSTANATITVIDSIQPLLTVPADITVFTNSGCGAFGFPIGSASASDNCSVISAITNNAPAFYPVGITNIQYSVTDGSGNTTIKIQKITVIDNIIPVITAPANINTTLTAGCTKTGVNLGTPVTTDNCTIASVTNNAPVAFPVGTTTVTWTVTDASGNSSTANQTVTVKDTINPTITAPSNITVNANSSCVAFNVVLGTPITADNCIVASVTNNAPAVFTLGTTTVTWTVTDASGNTATTIQTVTVVDNINPSIIAPVAITMNVIAGCSVSGLTLGTPFTLDNCSIASVTNNAPASFPVGSTTVTWIVTDGSGNTATATQLVTIIDNINPTITAPAAVTMNVVSGCSATGVVLGTPITADNCTVASVTNNAPTTFPIGTTTVVWTVTDASGKTATATQLVTIVDNINPTITAPSAVSVNLTNGCAASNVVLGTPITADNCSVASVTNNAPAIFQLGVTTVTWTVTDASGLTATSTQTVTVIDNINPTIVAPAAISMNITSGCNITGLALGTPFTADNCSVASVTNNAPTIFPIGSTTVTWTVTDGSGHTATATQLVTIIDNINPTITAPAAVTMNVVSGCTATGIVLGTPITADNCTVASVTNNAPTTFPIGTTTVVWTVTDASGKTATASQLVTIVDNINPTITAPTAVSVNLTNGCAASNVVLGTPITADNCSVASVTNNAPAIFQLGATIVTWTVTDASGLTATSTQTVTVIDNINPSIVAPAAISMNITTGCNVTGLALGTPYTSDNCSVATVTNNAPATFPIGSTTVTWTVTDGSGHTATATQLVTIIDNINPTITAPAAINSYIASGCSATGIVLGTPVTSDNCSVSSVTNNAPTSFPIGTTTVIWTVTDASGNTSTANQLVTVNDTLDPVITTPVAVTAYSNFGCQSVGVNLGTLTATDNCSIESITNNAPMFFPLGNTNVVWTVVDASGNSSTVTQLVTVVDTLKPTIIAPSNLEVASNTGCGASEISIGNPVVDDNCGVATINNDAPVVFVSGINIVTWTVTDNAGNVSTATQIVTVVDNVNPTAVLNNITVSLPVGSDAIITSDMIDNGSFDNCGNVTITLSQSTFNCDNLGNNTILVTVTDESGNFVSQSVVVTVNPSGIDLDLDGVDDACDQLIDETVNVPNGFTPDGDGINDKFVVVGLDSYTSKALTIYNRYGNMVYETNNYQNDWDGSSNGSELPDGTYFYILELNGSETKSGYVYINRVH
jgi:gliding motility-associated-like protein